MINQVLFRIICPMLFEILFKILVRMLFRLLFRMHFRLLFRMCCFGSVPFWCLFDMQICRCVHTDVYIQTYIHKDVYIQTCRPGAQRWATDSKKSHRSPQANKNLKSQIEIAVFNLCLTGGANLIFSAHRWEAQRFVFWRGFRDMCIHTGVYIQMYTYTCRLTYVDVQM